ncbi:MAG: Ribonuclease BN, partial [uncultured Friedmanniella sp.]
ADRRRLPALPGHRAGGRGGLLRHPVPAAADLRPRRRRRLRGPALRRADDRGLPGPGPRPLLPCADRGRGRRRHRPHPRRRALGWPLRGHLGRLRAGPVVGLAGAQRVRRHHHDHVRAGRAPRDRPHPGAVLQPLRRLPARRDAAHPAGARRARRRRPPAAGGAGGARRPLLAGGPAG